MAKLLLNVECGDDLCGKCSACRSVFGGEETFYAVCRIFNQTALEFDGNREGSYRCRACLAAEKAVMELRRVYEDLMKVAADEQTKIQLVVSPFVANGEVEFRDPVTGDLQGKIVNIGDKEVKP